MPVLSADKTVPGRAGFFDDFGLPDFQQLRFSCSSPAQKCERARPRREGAQPVPDLHRRQVPVNLAVLLFDFRGVGRRLPPAAAAARFFRRQNQESFRPAVPRRVAPAGRAGLRIVRRQNRRAARGQNRPGVEAGIHLHDGHAGFRFAVGDGPLDRRRAAIFRQQRGVDIQAAVRRQIQNRSAAKSGRRRRRRSSPVSIRAVRR